jgi:acetyl-CoA C-acetyltransferase
MSVEPSTPVVVAAAAVTHHAGEGFVPASATDLMLEAVQRALAGAGTAGGELGRLVGEVLVPHGTWPEPDPGRAVAHAVGAPGARSVRAELGVLQHTLVARAARALAEGSIEAAVVVGGENRWSGVVCGKAGTVVPGAPAAASAQEPDELLTPDTMVISAVEIERDLTTAAHQYAIIESALRHHQGRTVEEHQRHLGELWARFAAIAAATPSAWDRRGLGPDDIAVESDTNRLIAAPYTKWLVSQWNVDQSAALVLTTVATAERLGVPRSQWVFPLALVESNLVVTLPERADLHRWPAMAVCGAHALDAAGVTVGDIGPVDLYSCFPAAVQVTATELSLGLERDLTLTGGMTFGGGPYDNYVLQSMVAMVERLRHGPPDVIGLTTAVSGLLTKPAVTVWSAGDPRRSTAVLDVTEAARDATPTRTVDPSATGVGRIAGCTVVPGSDGARTAVAVVDVDGGARTVATTSEPSSVAGLLADDPVGRAVVLSEAGALTVPR